MKKDFYTESELMQMPLEFLRGLDIDNKDQEGIVQRIVNKRLSVLPPSSPIYRKDVPDIQTPEMELEWQKKIDERTAKLRPVMEDAPSDSPPSSEPEVQVPQETEVPGHMTDAPAPDLAVEEGNGPTVTIVGRVPNKLKSKIKK